MNTLKSLTALSVTALIAFAASSVSAQEKFDTAAMEKLAKDNNCISCHAAATKLVGPSHKMMSEKYAKDKDAVKTLSAKVIKGGSGVWGPIPMPANAQVKQDDAEKLVKWMIAAK